MIRNTPVAWGLGARALHWLIALMIAVQVPLGFWMVSAYDAWLATKGDPGPLFALARTHDTLGLLVLILVLARLGWRAGNVTPGLPPALAAWQRLTARLTHATLYALLLLFPLSGWATLSAYEGQFPIFFFGWDKVPRLVPQAGKGEVFNSDFFSGFHQTCWKAGVVILLLHVTAALWHEYLRRDGVLSRMWRGA